MNLTDIGHLLIAEAYYAVSALLVFVSYTAHRKGGYLRMVHPVVWLGASMFFFGCGSHHLDFLYHHVQNEKVAYDSIHHNVFVVMQVFGAIPFIFAVVPFVRKLSKLEDKDA